MKVFSVVILAAFLFILVEADDYVDYQALYDNETRGETTTETTTETERPNEITTIKDYAAYFEELEKNTTTDDSEPDILSFDESKRKTFGTVKYGVAKYECYARILEDFANLHGENDTIEEYVDDLRGLFLAWRECAQDDYVCKRTKWKAAEDHLNAFFFLSGIEDAVSEFFRDIRSKC